MRLYFASGLSDKLNKIWEYVLKADGFFLKIAKALFGFFYNNYGVFTRLIYVVILVLLIKKKLIPFWKKHTTTEKVSQPALEQLMEKKTETVFNPSNAFFIVMTALFIMYILVTVVL